MQAGDVPGEAIVESGPAYAARLFGPFVLLARDGTDVTPSGRKTRALAAHLLLAGGPVRRERLAGLLWGERAEEQARSSLRQAIYELRPLAAGDASLLTASRSQLSVDPATVLTDIDEIEAACRAGDAAAALMLIGPRPAELLADLDGVDPAFDEWLAVERSHRREQRRRQVLNLANRRLRESASSDATDLALALLAADSLDEAAVRIAMEAGQDSGDRDMTRRVYAQFEEALRRELGASPPEDLAALYRNLPGRTIRDACSEFGTDISFKQPRSASQNEAMPSAPKSASRRGLWSGLVVTTLAVLAAVGLWTWRSPSPQLRVQVMALQPAGGPAAAVFARTLQDNLTEVLTQSGVQTVSDAPPVFLSSARKPDVVLKGSVVETGSSLEVRLFLDDVDSGLTLWSEDFKRDAAFSDQLADAAAAAAGETVYTIGETSLQKGFELDPATLALFIRGEELVKNPQLLHEGTPRDIFEQVVARAPRFAAGHATLAVALVNEARIGEPAQRPRWLERAAREADVAIRIDPYSAGAAYDAHFLAERVRQPHEIVHAERWLQEGLRRAPEFPFLSMRECRLLIETGRGLDARAYCQRALALRPMAGPIGYSYALALSVSGAPQSAEQAIDRAVRYNPDHAMTRRARFEMAAFGDHPDRATALLDDPATRPLGLDETAVAALRSALRARQTGRRADIESAAAEVREATVNDGLDVYFGVEALAALGDIDGAYAILKLPKFEPLLFSVGASFLFEPWTAPLRADPRFWPEMAELGIAQHWTAHDTWPDFCGNEIALAACKAETARALSAWRAAGATSRAKLPLASRSG